MNLIYSQLHINTISWCWFKHLYSLIMLNHSLIQKNETLQTETSKKIFKLLMQVLNMNFLLVLLPLQSCLLLEQYNSIEISDGGEGYTSAPEVRIQQPISIGGTPFAGIGTTATAIATATISEWMYLINHSWNQFWNCWNWLYVCCTSCSSNISTYIC